MAAPVQLVSTAFISSDPTNNIGGIYLDSGNIVSNGKGSLTAATMAPTLLSGGSQGTAVVTLTKTETITPTKRVMRSTCATTTASAITLATAGMLDGQDLTLIHLGPSTITLSGNVNANITSAATGAYSFTYDAATTLWYHKV